MIGLRLLERLAAPVSAMMLPPASMRFDFLHPSGEAALVGPDSLSWRIFKNPVTLFIGGVGAVILELAEPAVRSGVWDHSSFRQDAVTRLRRTGAAAMMTVYGPAGAAREMIARVVRMHDKVSGTTPDGQPYHANDERLLDWVQATASYGFIEAYSRFARPLSDAERSTAFAEGAPAAQLYGAVGAPLSTAEWEALFARTLPRLERSSIVFDFLSIMNEAPLLPRPMRWLQRMLVKAAIDIVPAVLRERLGIAQMTPSAPERAAARMMARIADRLPLREAPPAQASMRMGRDAAFLYR